MNRCIGYIFLLVILDMKSVISALLPFTAHTDFNPITCQFSTTISRTKYSSTQSADTSLRVYIVYYSISYLIFVFDYSVECIKFSLKEKATERERKWCWLMMGDRLQFFTIKWNWWWWRWWWWWRLKQKPLHTESCVPVNNTCLLLIVALHSSVVLVSIVDTLNIIPNSLLVVSSYSLVIRTPCSMINIRNQRGRHTKNITRWKNLFRII